MIFNSLVAQDQLTPELLWKLNRVSGHEVSANGNMIVFGKSQLNMATNSSNRDLYSYHIPSKQIKQLTQHPYSEFNERWCPNGRRIGFLRVVGDGAQLFEINADGSDERQVTRIEGGIVGFEYAPTGNKILIVNGKQ